MPWWAIANNLTVAQIEQKNPTKDINWYNGLFVTSKIYAMIIANPIMKKK